METRRDERTSKRLSDLNHWVWAAQMQLERFKESFNQEFGSTADVDVDQSGRIYSNTSADIYLVCLVTYQVVKALQKMPKSSKLHAPDSRTALALRLLRNVHEHWDVTKRVTYVPTPADVSRLPRASRAFVQAFPGVNPFTLTIDQYGTSIAGLVNVNSLWNTLNGLEKFLDPSQRNPSIGDQEP